MSIWKTEEEYYEEVDEWIRDGVNPFMAASDFYDDEEEQPTDR